MAKKLIVGSITKRKDGRYKKDSPHHWIMLKEIVREKLNKDGIHPNSTVAKEVHSATAGLAKRKNQGAESYLKDNFSHVDNFEYLKTRAKELAGTYLSHLNAAYNGDNVTAPSKAFLKVKLWREELAKVSLFLKTDVERDEWVAERFVPTFKFILRSARLVLGPNTHLSMVKDTGFQGLCKVIITKAYDQGPSGISKDQIRIWEKAFNTMLKNSADKKLVPEAKALSMIYKVSDKPWYEYCIKRMALKNDGYVDLKQLEKYVVNAKKFHKTKNPPNIAYDMPNMPVRKRIT